MFVAAGFVYDDVLGVLHLATEHEAVKLVAEITLVWVLLSGAAKVDLQAFRSALGWYVRLLGIGLPSLSCSGLLWLSAYSTSTPGSRCLSGLHSHPQTRRLAPRS